MYFDLSAMQIILQTLVLGLAIGGIGAGGIALYFGSKKNRIVGSILLVVGVIALVLALVMYGSPFALANPFWAMIGTFILMVIGGGIGVAIIGVVFLLTVLR
jgi:polyferredoxin